MSKILSRLVSQLKAKGKSTKTAYAIATSIMQKSGNLKIGTKTNTAKGSKRGNMTPAERAKDRMAKISFNTPSFPARAIEIEHQNPSYIMNRVLAQS